MTVSGPEKLLYLTLGIMFLALGIVGLIVPILPGVLFLAGAVYMLSRGSGRIKKFADEHPALRGFQQRMNRLGTVGVLERVKVVSLMTLESAVTGIQKVTLGMRRLLA